MRNKWFVLALGAIALTGAAGTANAQAENSLVGIKLYDSGVRVVSIYGTPLEVQTVGGGGAGNIGGGGAGPASPGGGGSVGAPVGGRGGGGGSPMPAGTDAHTNPGSGEFGFANTLLQRGGTSPAPASTDEGGPGLGGRGGGGGGGVAGSGGSDGRILFTRWVYKRGGSKYGFVLDKFNRVVQIEAIGAQNAKVKTRRGIGFGSTFASIIRKYQSPDGYEINGDNLVVRYLVRHKVAFRLSRLGQNKPQVVTGIAVAAGKT